MIFTYKLVGKVAVPCEDVGEWGAWYSTADWRVGLTEVGILRVSTVFLGIDHNFCDDGDPLLFETMIFCDEDPNGRRFSENYCERYSSWEAAERGHEAAVVVAASAPRERVSLFARPDCHACMATFTRSMPSASRVSANWGTSGRPASGSVLAPAGGVCRRT